MKKRKRDVPHQRFSLQNESWVPPFNLMADAIDLQSQTAAFKRQSKQALPTNQKPADTKSPELAILDTQSKFSNNQKFLRLMRPRGKALDHPAGPTLLEYATKGCPVDCGSDWSREQIKHAIKEGPAKSAQKPKATTACHDKAFKRVQEGHCRLIKWDDIITIYPKS